jgi:hypothetical protein
MTLQDETVYAKKTITILRPQLLKDRCKSQYNVIACGSIRGGTSAMGLTLRTLGYFMGESVHEFTHEDIEFIDAVQTENISIIAELIKRRNVENPGWCLKLPSVLTLLEVFDENATAPIFLIVTRNQFSVAKSLVRRDDRFIGAKVSDYIAAYEHADLYLNEIRKIVQLRAPAIICEYEEMLKHPGIFIEELASALSLKLNPDVYERLRKLIGEKDYKTVDGVLAGETDQLLSPTPNSWIQNFKKRVLNKF